MFSAIDEFFKNAADECGITTLGRCPNRIRSGEISAHIFIQAIAEIWHVIPIIKRDCHYALRIALCLRHMRHNRQRQRHVKPLYPTTPPYTSDAISCRIASAASGDAFETARFTMFLIIFVKRCRLIISSFLSSIAYIL